MILNNLDPHVAQFPQELVTYGGNGQVFSNWAQVSVVTLYKLIKLQFTILMLLANIYNFFYKCHSCVFLFVRAHSAN